MKKLPFLLLPILAILLCACPYVSQVPISIPTQQADKMVFGDWVQLNADSTKGDEYSISEHDDGVWKYRIDGPEGLYDAWVTAVGKDWFLNICDPAKMSDGIMILRVDKMNFNRIELTPVSGRNKAQQFATPALLMEWIRLQMGKPSFYDDGERVRLVRS